MSATHAADPDPVRMTIAKWVCAFYLYFLPAAVKLLLPPENPTRIFIDGRITQARRPILDSLSGPYEKRATLAIASIVLAGIALAITGWCDAAGVPWGEVSGLLTADLP